MKSLKNMFYNETEKCPMMYIKLSLIDLISKALVVVFEFELFWRRENIWSEIFLFRNPVLRSGLLDKFCVLTGSHSQIFE